MRGRRRRSGLCHVRLVVLGVVFAKVEVFGVVLQQPRLGLDQVGDVLDHGQLVVADILREDQAFLDLGQHLSLAGQRRLGLEGVYQFVQVAEKLLKKNNPLTSILGRK